MKKNGWRKQVWNLTLNKESSAFSMVLRLLVEAFADGEEPDLCCKNARSTANTEVGVAYGKMKIPLPVRPPQKKNLSREGWPLDTVMRESWQ